MITPEMVVKAYQETGFTPSQKRFFRQNYRFDVELDTTVFTNKEACGLTALAVSANPELVRVGKKYGRSYVEGTDVINYLEGNFDIDRHYIDSWMAGFDNTEGVYGKSLHIQGYKDGRAAWEAVNSQLVNGSVHERKEVYV